jgi:hypothetical protein
LFESLCADIGIPNFFEYLEEIYSLLRAKKYSKIRYIHAPQLFKALGGHYKVECVMRRKFVLGILVLILAFSVILWGFSNFNGGNRDHNEEITYSLEPTQPEAEPLKSETTEPELTKAEPTETEPTQPEAEPLKSETTEPELTKAEPTETEPTQPEPKQTPEPEPAESEPTQQGLEPTSEPEPTELEPTQVTFPIQTNYSIPVANAIKFFEWSQQPEAMLWLDVMYRRFGIESFANSLQRFDQLYWRSEHPSVIRLFRRIADYNNPIYVEELLRVKASLDRITLPALYCDRLDLPSDYLMLLEEGVSHGGYQLTHVLLAWIWIQENGCELELPDGFIEDMYHANAALINTDSIVTDLELEAAAFLCLAGQSELIDGSFLEQVIASQDVDGGWGSSRRWHTTILGLLYLLHVEFPSDTYPPVLAPKPA